MMESKDGFRGGMEILQSEVFWAASVSDRWGKIDAISFQMPNLMQKPQFPKESMASPEGISANRTNHLSEAPAGSQGDAKNSIEQPPTRGDFGQVSCSTTHLN